MCNTDGHLPGSSSCPKYQEALARKTQRSRPLADYRHPTATAPSATQGYRPPRPTPDTPRDRPPHRTPRNEFPPPPRHHPVLLQPPAARTRAPQPADSPQHPTALTVGSARDVSAKYYSAVLSGPPTPKPATPPPGFPHHHHLAPTADSIRPVESVLKDFLASITACSDIVHSSINPVQLLQVTSELAVALRTNTNRVAGLRLVSRFLTIILFGIHG